MKALNVISFIIFISMTSAAKADFFPSPLISAEWLVDHIDDVLVLDTRKELDTFSKLGHIENAILVDVGEIRVNREIDGKKLTRMRHDNKSFQAFMRSHGVDNESKLVITHRGKSAGQVAGAARLYWQLKYYGFKEVALLDGGNAAWVAALEDLTEEATEAKTGKYDVGTEHPEILATMQQVKESLKDDSIDLVDTRGLRYHIGVDKKDYVFANGHIPNSKILPYKFLNPAKGVAVYYPKDKLKRIIEALDIDLNVNLIFFCNSAFECSSVWFVLHEILGKKDVRIYDGSLHQWTQYKSNPMTTSLTK